MADNTRDSLRSKLLGSKKAKSKELELFGAPIELRQPTLRQVHEMQQSGEQKNAIAQILITQAYVPGTNDKVFEETDLDVIMEWPVGDWVQTLSDAIEDLSGVSTKEAKKD